MATLAYHIFKRQVSYDGGITWQDTVPYETVKMPVTGVTCELPWSARLVTIEKTKKYTNPCSGTPAITSGCDYAYDETEYYYNVATGDTISSGDTKMFKFSTGNGSSHTKLLVTDDVETIGDGSFYRVNVGDIDLENANNLEKIGDYAFYNNALLVGNKLTKDTINFPDSLTEIGDYAFYGSDVSSIVFSSGSSINKIGNGAFSTEYGGIAYFNGNTPPSNVHENAFNSMYVIIVPNQHLSAYRNAMSAQSANIISTEHIGNGGKVQYSNSSDGLVTEPCDSTSSITMSNISYDAWLKIGDCLTTISGTNGDYLAGTRKILYHLDFGNTINHIGRLSFPNLFGIKTLVLPDSVRTIGDYAFAGSRTLSSITIPYGCENIGKCAFAKVSRFVTDDYIYYTNFQEITVNGGSVGELAFAAIKYSADTWMADDSAENIKRDITIGSGVTSIENYAFYGSILESDLVIPDSVTKIGYRAFAYNSGCADPNLCPDVEVTIGSGVTYIGADIFTDGYEGQHISKITINATTPPTVYHEDGTPVYHSPNIDYACPFSGCPIYVPEESYMSYITAAGWENAKKYITYEGMQEKAIFYYDSTIETVHCNESSALTKNEVKSVSSGWTEVTVGDCVSTIDGAAFMFCYSLETVNLPDSITEIGIQAFAGCTNLTNINIPSSVTSIGGYAFNSCSSLTSVTVPNSVTSIGSNAFGACTSLTSCEIGSGVASIGDSAFSTCRSLTSVTIGNSVASIGNNAFYGCSSLTSVTVPNSVTSIGDRAFINCSGLTSVTIGSGVTSFGEYAFYECSNITNLTFQNGLEGIGSGAFEYCRSLTSVVIPNSVTSIGNSAFIYCTSLTGVTIGSGVEFIGYYAFEHDTNLYSITCLATTPPDLFDGVFDDTNNCPIYVPSASLSAYQSAYNWSNYASRIHGI